MKNLSSVIFRFVVLLATILISSSIYAQWQCPTSCSCANDTVSVTCFGATPNDGISDTAVIQSAINSVPDNWTIYFPTGRYAIDQSLVINRNNLTLTGDGINSELYTPQGTNVILLKIADEVVSQQCPAVVPTNIVLQQLSLSGDLNKGQASQNFANLFGILIRNGENLVLKDLLVKDFGLEGISLSGGTHIPKNISFLRLRTQRIRRNAFHLGYGENITIQDSVFEDTGDDVWLPAPNSGSAIDLETEGLDMICNPLPIVQRVPFVYDFKIYNSLFKSPNSQTSKGGVQLAFSSGPVRKVDVANNVLINSGGISSVGFTFTTDDWSWIHDVDSRVGKSARIRDVNISSNWISNLHPSGDIATTALSVYASGDSPDSQGFNGVTVNNNALTVYQVGGNNRPFQFSTNKEITGNNNKTFRPYQITTDPVSGAYNFLWRRDQPSYFLPPQTPNYDNYNVQILNTFDNGYVGSRLNCYDPPVWAFCSSIGGAGNQLTWVNNPNPTPTTSPTINSVSVFNKLNLNISATDSNGSPVRVMVLRNGLPLGLKDTVNGSVSFSLSRKAIRGDVFYVQAFNQNGQFSEYTYTY
jgi:Pectate lyase superfamily protein